MKTEDLEHNATEQRDQIERTTHELFDKLAHTTLSHYLRENFAGISVIVSAIGFISGYIVGAVSSHQ